MDCSLSLIKAPDVSPTAAKKANPISPKQWCWTMRGQTSQMSMGLCYMAVIVWMIYGNRKIRIKPYQLFPYGPGP